MLFLKTTYNNSGIVSDFTVEKGKSEGIFKPKHQAYIYF